MKKLSLLAVVIAVLIATTSYGQKDTIFTSLSQENGMMQPQQFMSEYDRAFGLMTPSLWMFKMDIGKTVSSILNYTVVDFGAEIKIAENVSLEANLQYEFRDLALHYGDYYTPPGTRLGLGARWYFNMKKRIAAGKSVSNCSGNYLGFETAYLYKSNDRGPYLKAYQLTTKFGIQRRLLKYGYFDLGYDLGARRSIAIVGRSPGYWSVTTQQRLAIGLAYFSPTQKGLLSGTACGMFKCYQENRHMLKIDLYNLLHVDEFSSRLTLLNINPSVAFEQKIASSPFSAELTLESKDIFYNLRNYGPEHTIKSLSGIATTELRWYFLQKRRILQGRSGNNLSGVFFGLNATGSFNKTTRMDGENDFYDYYNYGARAVLGIQHRFLDHGFVQLKVGGGPNRIKGKYLPGGFVEAYQNNFNKFIELKAGLAF